MTAQINTLFTNVTLYWNQYGKQVLFLLMVLLLLATLLAPNMTVFANGATSNAGG